MVEGEEADEVGVEEDAVREEEEVEEEEGEVGVHQWEGVEEVLVGGAEVAEGALVVVAEVDSRLIFGSGICTSAFGCVTTPALSLYYCLNKIGSLHLLVQNQSYLLVG